MKKLIKPEVRIIEEFDCDYDSYFIIQEKVKTWYGYAWVKYRAFDDLEFAKRRADELFEQMTKEYEATVVAQSMGVDVILRYKLPKEL